MGNHELESLTLSTAQLLQKYAGENLLSDQTGSGDSILLAQSLAFDNSQARIPSSRIFLKVDHRYPRYQFPNAIAAKARQLLRFQTEKRPDVFDSTTIRLNGLEQEEESLMLLVSKATYLDYLGTNYSMDLRLPGWARSLRELIHPGDSLLPLDSCCLANHMGIGVLLFTDDGFLALQRRAQKKLIIRQSQLASSISGAGEFTDLLNRESCSIHELFFREGREELNLDPEEDYDLDSIVFLGITRELLRGGKPELFFSAHLTCPGEELLKKFRFAKDNWENTHIELVAFESLELIRQGASPEEIYPVALADIRRLRENYDLLSLPLRSNLVLWLKWVAGS